LVLGLERAKAGDLPTDPEHAEMKRLLHEAMDAGARGWSAQWMQAETAQRDYDGSRLVADLLHDETVLHLADVLAERDDGFIQLTHSRVNGNNTDFFETLARRSGRPILFNTVVARPSDPSMHRSRLAWLADCRRRGLPVYGQGITSDGGYTFSFDEWNLFDEMPAWREATLGTVDERLEKLSDPARRPALREQRPWMALRSIEEIRIEAVFSSDTAGFVGRTVGEVAADTGRHPTDALLDIATADGLQATFSSLPGFVSDEGFRDLIQDDYIIPGISDGGAHMRFSTAGSYPTGTIIRAVRDEGLLSLEDVHWRLSALPARCAGFVDRGTLVPGMAADVVVYDFDALALGPVERVTDLPGGEWRRVQRATGYSCMVVNGEVTMVDGKETDARSGKLIRR
jgi:N-acyl-D-aspartate/D-glutamate deacylase